MLVLRRPRPRYSGPIPLYNVAPPPVPSNFLIAYFVPRLLLCNTLSLPFHIVAQELVTNVLRFNSELWDSAIAGRLDWDLVPDSVPAFDSESSREDISAFQALGFAMLTYTESDEGNVWGTESSRIALLNGDADAAPSLWGKVSTASVAAELDERAPQRSTPLITPHTSYWVRLSQEHKVQLDNTSNF